jgi:hypothetical protein
MARKHSLKCAVGTKRFTVIEIFDIRGGAASADTYAGRSFAAALKAAQPDRGSVLRVHVTCAHDAGEARLPSNFRKNGKLIKSIRYKRGG